MFDHGWAAALERAGGRYYPKLQVSVPFTPATGPRLLLHPEAGPETADLLVAAMVEVARRHKVSSLHVTFPTEREWQRLGAAGFLQRVGRQFHWENPGYRDFDDFLAALTARKRKQIKRERRDAMAGGIEIETLTGAAIETRHWDAFFDFYISTSDRKWGSPYLTRAFFDLLGERMGDRVALVMARQGKRYVAGALNLIGDGDAVWAQLGLPRRLPVPAFRGVLLPRHRLRHRPRLEARRGRRPRPAQDPARLPAAADL